MSCCRFMSCCRTHFCGGRVLVERVVRQFAGYFDQAALTKLTARFSKAIVAARIAPPLLAVQPEVFLQLIEEQIDRWKQAFRGGKALDTFVEHERRGAIKRQQQARAPSRTRRQWGPSADSNDGPYEHSLWFAMYLAGFDCSEPTFHALIYGLFSLRLLRLKVCERERGGGKPMSSSYACTLAIVHKPLAVATHTLTCLFTRAVRQEKLRIDVELSRSLLMVRQ